MADNKEKKILRQWVLEVSAFSSQYGNPSWQAANVSGPPRVFPQHGDNALAWAAAPRGSREYIELVYDKAVVPVEIIIYETYHAGGVRTVSAKDDYGNWIPIYNAENLENILESRKLSLAVDPEGTSRKLTLPSADFVTRELRIDIDQSLCNDWAEIDAVELVGFETSESGLTAQLVAYFNSVLSEALSGNPSRFSDVTFNLRDSSRIQAQRIVLARNDYFSNLFSKYQHHQEIPQLDVGLEIFQLLLQYCYTDKFPSDNINVLVEFATKYSAEFCIPESGMRTLLMTIKPLVTPENAADFWWDSYKATRDKMDEASSRKLCEICCNVVSNSFGQVASDSGHFAKFERDDLIAFIAQVGAQLGKRLPSRDVQK